MIGSFGEFERKVINERTKSGRLKKGQDGKYCGGKVAYGYTLQNGDVVVLNPIEAEIIKEVFGLKLQKLSLQQIADHLTVRGYRTRNGDKWNRQSVGYVLKNKLYCGWYSYNGEKENNNITFKVPRIVSAQVYNKVNLAVNA
jgi:DNA invertase Pin-like site-specific DNA recombinase